MESPTKRPGINKNQLSKQKNHYQCLHVLNLKIMCQKSQRVSNMLYNANNHRNNGPPAILYHQQGQ